MFLKKEKAVHRASWITLLNADGAALNSCPTGEFALPEDVVVQLSIEYFNDPEPCAIHRGAVHRRAMMELLEHCPIGEAVTLEQLDPKQRGYFAENVAAVRIEEKRR